MAPYSFSYSITSDVFALTALSVGLFLVTISLLFSRKPPYFNFQEFNSTSKEADGEQNNSSYSCNTAILHFLKQIFLFVTPTPVGTELENYYASSLQSKKYPLLGQYYKTCIVFPFRVACTGIFVTFKMQKGFQRNKKHNLLFNLPERGISSNV